jgi:hypothetical protein
MLKVTFKFEKETKNAWRYRAADGQAIPGYNTLYLSKVEGQSAPKPTIEVQISWS